MKLAGGLVSEMGYIRWKIRHVEMFTVLGESNTTFGQKSKPTNVGTWSNVTPTPLCSRMSSHGPTFHTGEVTIITQYLACIDTLTQPSQLMRTMLVYQSPRSARYTRAPYRPAACSSHHTGRVSPRPTQRRRKRTSRTRIAICTKSISRLDSGPRLR